MTDPKEVLEYLDREKESPVCDHGRLKRKCEICELRECKAENTALRAKLSALREHFGKVKTNIMGSHGQVYYFVKKEWWDKAREILGGE